jgi:signal transduction histidine kinase
VLRQLLNSWAFRVTAFYIIGLSLLVFAGLLLFYSAYSYGYFQTSSARLQADLARLQGDDEAAAALLRVVNERVGGREFFVGRSYAVEQAPDGTIRAGSLPPDAQLHFIDGGWLRLRTATFRAGGFPERAVLLAASTRLPDGTELIAARDITEGIAVETLVFGILLRAALGTIVIGLLGGALLASLSLKQLAQVNQSIQRILAGDLSQRIRVGRWQGDVREVSRNFNRMLDRIQELMASVRQVSDNIAHDLRTPLTRMRNQLASLQREMPPEARHQVQDILDEADGLLVTSNALLRISQIESGVRRSEFARLDLSVVLADVAEFYEPLAADKEITLAIDASRHCLLQGDRDLLFQAFANLLDNAIKYTPAGGRIDIATRAADTSVEAVVADSGPGVAEAEREKVFRRFYRVEASRSEQPGNGLGLSLVRAVVNLHHGAITLDDNRPGLRVSVRLPVSGLPSVHGHQ